MFITSFRYAHKFQNSQLERTPSRNSPSLQVSSPPNANCITHSLCVFASTAKHFFFTLLADHTHAHISLRLPTWLSGKESASQCRRRKRFGFNPWVGKIPWRRNPIQFSCLGNPMDRGVWWAAVHEVTKSRTRLNMHALLYDRLALSPARFHELTLSLADHRREKRNLNQVCHFFLVIHSFFHLASAY